MVHVFLQKVKEINVPEGESSVDPMLVVESLGVKAYSSAKDNIGALSEVVYGEHLFLEARGVDRKQAEEAKICLKLVDKGMLKDKLIGQFDLDLSFVYLKDKHVMQHKWLALSNPNNEDYAKIQCYMKISVAVCCQGDEQVQLEDDTSHNEDTDVMMSPALNPKFYQIKIRLFEGQDLPPMDQGIGVFSKDKIDAYLKLDFKGKKYKTQVITQNKGGPPVKWNKEFWLPAQIPVSAPKIEIRLMDEDDIGSDEMAGTIRFFTKDIIEGKVSKGMIWKNVYGAPLNQKSSKEKTMMNETPDLASCWKGRILCQVECEQTDKPLAKVVNIEDANILQEAVIAAQPKEYQMMVQIGQVVSLPTTQKYKMKVVVGGHEVLLEPVKQNKANTSKRYGRYPNEKELEKQIMKLPYVDVEDFGTVFVSLIDEDDNPVCYYKAPVTEFMHPNPKELLWFPFYPDNVVKKVRELHHCGHFSMRLSIVKINPTTKNIELDFLSKDEKQALSQALVKAKSKNQNINEIKMLSDFPAWNQKIASRLSAIKIRAYIYQCRDLPAADAEGTSDPYIEVWDLETKKKKTDTVFDNTNPLFYQAIDLEYEVENEDDVYTYPPFIFDVFDYDDDLFDKTPDFLGRAIVEPEDCEFKYNCLIKLFKCVAHQKENCRPCQEDQNRVEMPQAPHWFPIYYTQGGPQCGEILVSFAVAPSDYSFCYSAKELNLAKYVNTRDFTVNMLILGLRELASPGILPVKKAFIKFNITSLVPPNGPSVKNIQTQPGKPGPNPTLNTTMKFSIPLPTDPLYCPRLSCSVYDQIFKNWSQPLIGVFTLPIGELMLALAQERKDETAKIMQINEELEKIITQAVELPDPLPIKQTSKVSQQYSVNASEYSDTKVSEYSRNSMVEDDNQKLITKNKKSRKSIEKSLKKAIDTKEITERLDANEQDGLRIAIDVEQDQIAQAKQLIEDLKSGGGKGTPLNAGVPKDAILSQISEANEKIKRLEQNDRNRAIEDAIQMGNDPYMTIIYPVYAEDKRLKIQRETNKPPKELYIELGYDETPGQNKKHYRKYYPDELENNTDIFKQKSPFNTYNLKKGQTRGAQPSLFSSNQTDESGQTSTEQCVGFFKSIIEVENPQDKENYEKNKKEITKKLKGLINDLSLKVTKQPYSFSAKMMTSPNEREAFELYARKLKIDHLRISEALANLNSDEILKNALMKEEKCVIRFYAISGFDMASRDMGSASDTYLVVTCNGKKYSERENYQLDQPNPDFYKSYDFEGIFPGTTPLKIQVWDYDELFGDELVGTSLLDLEDRYFTLDWMALKEKPVEYRQLYHPSSKMSQGVVKCWVEINKVNVPPEEEKKLYDISPKPAVPLEVRICVLNCKDIAMDSEGIVDAYFRGFFDTNEEIQETDTHYRNTDGKPDFQYRLVYKVKYPKKVSKFTLQGYDRDFFKSNEMFGETTIELNDIMEDVSLIKGPLSLNKKYYQDVLKPKYKDLNITFDDEDSNKFWLTLWAKNKSGKREKKGQVAFKIDVYPQEQADKNPVGKARDQPNINPTLPQPEGRLELSLNPLKMLNQLLPPAIKRKIMIALCVIACLALFAMILPNLISAAIMKLF